MRAGVQQPRGSAGSSPARADGREAAELQLVRKEGTAREDLPVRARKPRRCSAAAPGCTGSCGWGRRRGRTGTAVGRRGCGNALPPTLGKPGTAGQDCCGSRPRPGCGTPAALSSRRRGVPSAKVGARSSAAAEPPPAPMEPAAGRAESGGSPALRGPWWGIAPALGCGGGCRGSDPIGVAMERCPCYAWGCRGAELSLGGCRGGGEPPWGGGASVEPLLSRERCGWEMPHRSSGGPRPFLGLPAARGTCPRSGERRRPWGHQKALGLRPIGPGGRDKTLRQRWGLRGSLVVG